MQFATIHSLQTDWRTNDNDAKVHSCTASKTVT